MKKSLMATLVAASMLSPVAFAAEPMELSTAQMDSITAGTGNAGNAGNAGNRFNVRIFDINIARTVQIVNQEATAVTIGRGSSFATNIAVVSNNVRQN